MNGQTEFTHKHENLFLSLPRTNSYEDLFTATAKSKGDVGIVSDFRTGRRSDSVLTEVGRPRRGWSKRTQIFIAFGVSFVVILLLCIFLGVFVGRNGSGDSSTDEEVAVQSNTETTTSDVQPVQSSTASSSPTTSSESTLNPVQTSPGDNTTTTEPPIQSSTGSPNLTTMIESTSNTATESTSNSTPESTSNSAPESTSNSAPVSPGEWSSWESWTSCSVTCGSGVHVRYRSCNKTETTDVECEGQYVQQAVCTLDDCPVIGKWSTWSQWGDCGAFCGGGVRSRSRQCNKVSSTDVDCVGETVQQTTCNEWDCPDCSKTCSVGSLNDACDTCVCESSTVQGRVLSTAGNPGSFNPVSFAEIAAETAPMKVIAQSNSTGFFSIDDACIPATVILTREGFQDKVVEITATYQTIYMGLEVLPRITEHPQPKYRITGEDVSFCCSAVSAPAITYYEWFHNSVILDGSLYTDNGTKLEMKNVQPSDSGEYTCRANNEVRGIYSNKATLNVRDDEYDFCEDALQEKQVKLPEVCAQPGRNTTLYEVGECALKTCRQGNANATDQCRDSSKSCCFPSKIETKTINCTDYEIELILVKACSCGPCDSTQSVQVLGKVVSAESGSPVEYAEVWLNGELETYASDTGTFYITVADSIGKAVFTIKDIYRNIYLDTTKVVEISDGVSGTISVTIKMLEMSDPVTIDSTTEAVLSLERTQNDSSSPVALIKVPANAFYRNDGSAYTGMVYSFVTFIDPTDDNTQDAIPGIFQVIDEEGSTIDLESKGMFNLQFQDGEGGDLYVDGFIEVSFSDQAADNFTLWMLNAESGLWESLDPNVQAYSRKRRQVKYKAENVIGEIDTSIAKRRWFNIDKMIRYLKSGYICYYKSRLYKDDSLSEEVMNDNAQYKVDYRVVSGQTLVTLYNWFMSDWMLRQQCFAAACNNKVGYISLETYHVIVGGNTYSLIASQPLLTDQKLNYRIMKSSTTIGVSMVSSNNGPFYNSYSTCKATDKNQSHLRFHKMSTPDIYTARYFSPGGRPFGPNRKIMDTVWYPKRGSLHMICLMKVKITFSKSVLSSETSLKFHVFSFGGDNPNVKNFLFGIREYEVDISETTQHTCAEYKCSGNLEQSTTEIDYTRVKIALASKSSYSCKVQDISANIVNYSLNVHLRNPLWYQRVQYAEAYVPDIYGSSWGIYEAHTHSKDFGAARIKVDKECNTTYNQRNEGASVHFHCQIP